MAIVACLHWSRLLWPRLVHATTIGCFPLPLAKTGQVSRENAIEALIIGLASKAHHCQLLATFSMLHANVEFTLAQAGFGMKGSIWAREANMISIPLLQQTSPWAGYLLFEPDLNRGYVCFLYTTTISSFCNLFLEQRVAHHFRGIHCKPGE